MKIQIKNRFNASVIFECEADSLSRAVQLAIKQKINLSGAKLPDANLPDANLSCANLAHADLSAADLSCAKLPDANLSHAYLAHADLSAADLSCANLSRADLSHAYLPDADLSAADLSCANLSRADLSHADLSCANLSRADLSDADLSNANLSHADLSRADLSHANLSRAKGINKYKTTQLLMLLDQPGQIRAYKLVNAKGEGPFNGGLVYEVGKKVFVTDADTDENTPCAAGVNLATLDWCMREWNQSYKILLCEFTAADIAAIPTCTDGKFRVHRCKVVSEVDLVKIGLVEQEKEA